MNTLTFAQAAAALGVHADDVRRWVRTEQCPVVMVGRARRIPREWVMANAKNAPPVRVGR